MAYWNGKKIIYRKPIKAKHYPGWLEIDCGCCAGIQWGGEEPRECDYCGGSGAVYQHEKSGVLSQYPGGPFCGRISPEAANQSLINLKIGGI